ncbi:glycosyltransferase family 2 protein [Aeromonas enteropelogenes]|uniref:glycosyltransferase family 2 protein n=1 Tax=Aeromonas enteropelogenes TaxID=29489 RepID=UPI001CCDD21A|nr:glycosyltransferase family A protein [Aeromonas enteropelogenes]UBH29259.1 glycosyltransferase family 2 protein [Aeromonas enteropelogenes]
MVDVSVVIPYYNGENTISQSLQSICEQTFIPREVIIIDDCSVDKKVLSDIVVPFSKKLNIRLHSLSENRGAAYARNMGVALSSSSLIAFLDSDDVWHPKKIEVQYKFMLESNAHISAHYYIPNVNLKNMESSDIIKSKRIKKINFLIGNPFFTPTVMIKRDMVMFNPNYRVVDDYCCWLENIKKGPAFLIKIPLAGGFKAAIGASGLTGNIANMHKSYKIVLKDLYYKKEISFSFFFAAYILENLKYPLRILKCTYLKWF